MRTILVTVSLLFAGAIHAQISPRAADAIVPVIGSTRGLSSSNFKTELQMNNNSESRMAGWLIFHAAGRAGTIDDPVLRYDLAPHATVSYADVLSALDSTGLGSLDVFVDRGGIPTIVARAFDDQPHGTNGVTVPLIPAADALISGNTAALIAPRDLTRFRCNIGIRTLDNGATIDIIVRDANGAQRNRRSASYAATYFEQFQANAFAGIDLNANDSIEIRVLAGSIIVYASTVDNQTNDSSLQVLRR